MPETPHPEVQHEYRDFKLWVVAVVGGATGLLIVVGLLAAWLLFRHFDHRESAAKAANIPLLAAEEGEQFRGQPPLEGLLDRPPRDEAERERLTHYGWVDRDKGIVHVPLERAMHEALANKDKYLKSRVK